MSYINSGLMCRQMQRNQTSFEYQKLWNSYYRIRAVERSGAIQQKYSFRKMFYIFILFLLTLTNESVVMCSTMVPKRSKNCKVSLSVPELGIKIVCEEYNGYHIDQKLRSSDNSLSSLRSKKRNHIDTCTLTRNAKCSCITDIPKRILIVEQNVANFQAKVKSLEHYKDANSAIERQRKAELIPQTNAKGDIDKRKFARTIRHLIRKELSVIKQEMKQDIDKNVLLSHKCLEMNHSEKEKQTIDNLLSYIKVDPVKDTNSGLNNQRLEPMQADSSFIESRQDKPNVNYANAKPKGDKVKRSVPKETYLISNGDDKAYIRHRFEEIEHDIETLANGMYALHENMFESGDIKKQFEYEIIAMKKSIKQTIDNKHSTLELETEYIKNQTQIVYKLQQTTMKSQMRLQASIQIFKQRIYSIERRILKISSQLDALKETLDLNYSDTLPVDNAMQMADMEEIISFVAKMKKFLPTLMKSMRTMAMRQNNVIKVVNNFARKSEKERNTPERHEQNGQKQVENSAARNCFGTYILIIGITAAIPYCVFSY